MNLFAYLLLYSVATDFLEIFSNKMQRECLSDHRAQLQATEQVHSTGRKSNSQTRHADN